MYCWKCGARDRDAALALLRLLVVAYLVPA
jgi:hypothetical protein